MTFVSLSLQITAGCPSMKSVKSLNGLQALFKNPQYTSFWCKSADDSAISAWEITKEKKNNTWKKNKEIFKTHKHATDQS